MAPSTRSAIALDCAVCGGVLEPDDARSPPTPPLCRGARDFSSEEAVERLRAELAAPDRPGSAVVLGSIADPYLQAEPRLHVTRSVLQVLAEAGHPVVIATRSARIVRDLDLLLALANRNLARIFMAIATLDPALGGELEPQASPPMTRVEAIRQLADAGLHIGVLVSPLIPGLTSTDLETVLEAAAASGAAAADYALLRLPSEARASFADWLRRHQPHRAHQVIGLLDARDVHRSAAPGAGPLEEPEPDYAALLARRFDLACRRFLLDRVPAPLCCGRFQVPP